MSGSAATGGKAGSKRRGHHARSTAVVANASGSSQASLLSDCPITTTVKSSSANTNSNPLLQSDVTASDLFSQYTPSQILHNLASIKAQLETYDSELRALINSRYRDVLSIGNTITAMAGSSEQLTRALSDVSRGMKNGLNPKKDEFGCPSRSAGSKELKDPAGHEQEPDARIRHVAALLLIVQEGPEEIWRILDSLTAPVKGKEKNETARTDRAATILTPAKERLRTARKLATAVSLLEAVSLAGSELKQIDVSDDSSHSKASDLFPHLLDSHTGTVASLSAEIKLRLETNISQSSVSLASAASLYQAPFGALRAAFEASFRTNLISMLSLILLSCGYQRDLSAVFFQSRQERLFAHLEQQKIREASDYCNSLLTIISEIFDLALSYSRIFTSSQGKEGSSAICKAVINMQRDTDSTAVQASHQTAQTQWQAHTPLAAIVVLASADRIISDLSPQSSIRRWRPFSRGGGPGGSNDDQKAALQIFMTGTLDSIDKSSNWLRRGEVLGSVTEAGNIRRKVARFFKVLRKILASVDIQSVTEVVDGTLATLEEKINHLLRAQIFAMRRREIERWRQSVIKHLHESLASTAAKQLHAKSAQLTTETIEDVFRMNSRSPRSSAQISLTSSRKALQRMIDGRTSTIQRPLSRLYRGWKALSRDQQSYFASLQIYDLETSRTLETELQEWALVAAEGWSNLLQSVVDEFDQYSHQDTETLALCAFVRAFFTLPKISSLGQEISNAVPAKSKTLTWEERKVEVVKRRAKALSKWKATSVGQAAALFLGMTHSPLSDEARFALQRAHVHEGRRTEGSVTASTYLIRSLCLLQEASDEVIPPLTSPSKTICELGAGDQASTSGHEIGSMGDLLIAFRSEIMILLQRDAFRRDHFALSQDLHILQHLTRKVTGQAAAGEGFAIMQSLLSVPEVEAGTVNLQETLSPYALWLGQLIDVGEDPLVLPHAQDAQLSFRSPVKLGQQVTPSLMKLAPFRDGGRILGVAIQ